MNEEILTKEYWVQEFGEDIICDEIAFTEYINLIKEALKENYLSDDEYFEKHHIVPKSFNIKKFKKPAWNLVKLNARDHYLAHCYLVDALCGEYKQKMMFALHQMTNGKQKHNYIITAGEYEKAKLINGTASKCRWNNLSEIEKQKRIAPMNTIEAKKKKYTDTRNEKISSTWNNVPDELKRERAKPSHTLDINQKRKETMNNKTEKEK